MFQMIFPTPAKMPLTAGLLFFLSTLTSVH